MSALEMNQYQPMDEKTVKINRIKLIAIFAVAVVPVILAFTMYFGGVAVPSAKTNKGNLIWPPVQISALNSDAQAAKKMSIEESVLASKKWTLLITGAGECEKACRDLVHTVRQVNVSMAKEMDRVTRVMSASITSSEVAAFEAEYPNMLVHQIDRSAIAGFEAEAINNGAANANDAWKVWIVDPLGNVIIQYTEANDGYDMIHDLKKLLKLSNIG